MTEREFWEWFEQNQDDLFAFEKDEEAIFDRLAEAMNQVHEDLTFEFGPVDEDGARPFVISAGGIKSAFPSVESLYAAAPTLPKWRFIKYRQRSNPINTLEYADREIKASDVHYLIFKDEDPDKVGIAIFLDGYTEEDHREIWGQIGYLLLDDALGEYDVETRVGAIAFFDRTSEHFQHARPLPELPAHFDRTIAAKG